MGTLLLTIPALSKPGFFLLISACAANRSAGKPCVFSLQSAAKSGTIAQAVKQAAKKGGE